MSVDTCREDAMPDIPDEAAPTACCWDIFCSVVDNFGDAGVCWRLCRQLAAEHGLRVRLWIDDVAALKQLWPAVELVERQRVAGVDIGRWHRETIFPQPGAVVIEAFACHLPIPVVAAMAGRQSPPVWLNLEYLSAEAWVADYHGLPSQDPHTGLTKYFYFPGFDEQTGGLLRERDLSRMRDQGRAALRQSAATDAWLAAQLGLGEEVTGRRLVSLFAYETSAVAGLVAELARGPEPWLCLVPAGRVEPLVARAMGLAELPVDASVRQGCLAVRRLPFLRQDHYDRLLWRCDFNIVRGEDSFVRAQWAGKPMLWHIYPQADGAHWPKLDAFLGRYAAGLAPSLAEALRTASRAWVAGDASAAMGTLLSQLSTLEAHAEAWAARLAAQTDLASRLVQFCANRV